MFKKWMIVFMMAAMAAMIVGAGSGHAVVRTWAGGSGPLWSTAGNWVGGVPPTADDDVVFDANSVADLTNTCDIGALGGGAGITITVDNPSADVVVTLTVPIDLKAAGTQVTVGTTDALSLSGSTITLLGVTTFSVGAGQTLTITNVIGGASAIAKTGAGTLILDGDTSYAGATDVNGGTLIVNGTQAGTGAYTIFAGATLGGTGTTGSAITINNLAFFNPGATGGGVGTFTTTGAFTFAAGSTYFVDILNATSDKLVVGGLYTGGAGRVIDLGSVTSSQAILYTVLTAGAAPFPFGTNNTGWTQSVSGNNIQLLGTASITAIPTLTEWGLIIFALLIATFALRSMRMKKYKTA